MKLKISAYDQWKWGKLESKIWKLKKMKQVLRARNSDEFKSFKMFLNDCIKIQLKHSFSNVQISLITAESFLAISHKIEIGFSWKVH